MRYKTALVLLLVLSCLGTACAGPSAKERSDIQKVEEAQADLKPTIFAEEGIAIRGYDPVAYFTESQPVKGSEEHSYEYLGAIWQFSSAENRDAFENNPEQYAPQYGGYCAWAVKEGSTAPIDPNAWKIVDGKLYLNFNQTVQEKWQKDMSGNIAKADQNWPGVLKK